MNAYESFLEDALSFIRFRLLELDAKAKSLIDPSSAFAQDEKRYQRELGKIASSSSSALSEATLDQRDVIHYLLDAIIDDVQAEEALGREDLAKDQAVMDIYSLIAAYRKLEQGFVHDEEGVHFSLPEGEIPPRDLPDLALLHLGTPQKTGQIEYRPLLGLLFAKSTALFLFAISLGFFVYGAIGCSLAELGGREYESAGQTFRVQGFDFFVERRESFLTMRGVFLYLMLGFFTVVLGITIFDLIRLRKLKKEGERGNVSARYAEARYLSCNPFVIHNLITFITRTNKKLYLARIDAILDCASLGYVPAIYDVALFHYRGSPTIKKDEEAALKYFKMCGSYKRARFFVDELERRR